MSSRRPLLQRTHDLVDCRVLPAPAAAARAARGNVVCDRCGRQTAKNPGHLARRPGSAASASLMPPGPTAPATNAVNNACCPAATAALLTPVDGPPRAIADRLIEALCSTGRSAVFDGTTRKHPHLETEPHRPRQALVDIGSGAIILDHDSFDAARLPPIPLAAPDPEHAPLGAVAMEWARRVSQEAVWPRVTTVVGQRASPARASIV